MDNLQRKRVFVDRAVQGALVWRMLAYWAACVLFITVPLLIGRTLVEPETYFFEQLGAVWRQFGPALTCTIVILPLVLYDVVKFTNRFAGPMFRLRREMRRLARGEPVRPMRFRGSDFWQQFAVSFNQIAERLQQVEHSPGPEGDADADADAYDDMDGPAEQDVPSAVVSAS